jgi:hypothetical protein
MAVERMENPELNVELSGTSSINGLSGFTFGNLTF